MSVVDMVTVLYKQWLPPDFSPFLINPQGAPPPPWAQLTRLILLDTFGATDLTGQTSCRKWDEVTCR